LIRVKCETLYAKPGFGFAVRFVELTEGIATRLERGLKKIREGEDNWVIG
jgi:hypothetical protein